ncbi:hemerythrin domain-containing protein [Piscinibacter sp. XHJ-5]|uniref:hemerythrin domain-containing protein n=1 Tax=Piscinibacter sp. XHJ-5 TaxID=3037797 RepID=UPI002452C61F|nr:hemerythrin domain-containing protein [Piscinibacter sp. XHJ-5]
MLAAESAWRVLRAEHSRMRELLTSIDSAMHHGRWRAGPQLAALRELVHRLRSFEASTHKPKGVVLLATLRGRSPEADMLLDELERETRRCDELLSGALGLLDDAERGDADAAAQCAALLAEHREMMLAHLDKEDTLLRSQTARLLTAEEWSSVVSSISSVVARSA